MFNVLNVTIEKISLRESIPILSESQRLTRVERERTRGVLFLAREIVPNPSRIIMYVGFLVY